MEIKKCLRENDWSKEEHGWGNGYVGVPPGHPWYEVNYRCIRANVYGGLSYSSKSHRFGAGLWWLGFDTIHPGDNCESCDYLFVKAQTEDLYQQAVKASQDNVLGDFG